MRIAKDQGKRLDVHVDQENNPFESETELLALKTIEHGLEGRVSAVHAISVAAKPKEDPQEHEQHNARTQPSHPVDVRDGSALAEVLGRGQLMVNSTHHQAVSKVGPSLKVSATAPDGVVEAIESTEHPFALGVQWHPELLLQSMPLQLGLYRALVQKAREARR